MGMANVVSGRILWTDVSTQSGFSYGLISIDAGNQGRMDFRYDMSSRGPIPSAGTYVTITYAEGTPPKVMEIRVAQSGSGAPSVYSSAPAWDREPSAVVSPQPTRSPPSVGGFRATETEYSEGPQVGWSVQPGQSTGAHGPEISLDAHPPSPSYTRHDAYASAKTGAVSIIAAIEILLGMTGLFFCLFLLIISPLVGLFAVIADLMLFAAAAGLYSMREWGRLLTIVIAALMFLTIVGAVAGIPILWYLNREDIKRLFI